MCVCVYVRVSVYVRVCVCVLDAISQLSRFLIVAGGRVTLCLLIWLMCRVNNRVNIVAIGFPMFTKVCLADHVLRSQEQFTADIACCCCWLVAASNSLIIANVFLKAGPPSPFLTKHFVLGIKALPELRIIRLKSAFKLTNGWTCW